MQVALRTADQIKIGTGSTRLGMSVGVHTGDYDLLLVGSHHRELLVVGPAATTLAALEKAAASGDVLLSPQTAGLLGPPYVGERHALLTPPAAVPTPARASVHEQVDVHAALSAPLRDHLLGGLVDHEHRLATMAFVQVDGVDELRETQGIEAMVEAISYVVDVVQQAAADTDVTMLSTSSSRTGCGSCSRPEHRGRTATTRPARSARCGAWSGREVGCACAPE